MGILHRSSNTAATLLAVLLGASGAPARAADGGAPLSLEDWRAQRVAALTSDSGFLTLAGLYWLEKPRSSFGRARSSTFMLEHPAMPRRLGQFERAGDTVYFTSARRDSVFAGDVAVTRIEMRNDRSESPTVLRHGPIEFFVIERSGRLGVRVRALDSPRRRDFPGIEYFDASDAWRLTARFEAYEPVRQIEIVNVLGMEDDMPSPGAIVFEKDGREWRLDTIDEDPASNSLLIMFADGTSGRTSYGAGRFLYVERPRDGQVIVDFNRAYNPPCAFSDFATCPLPPPQNRLELAVTAGERKFPPAGVAH
jgi:uncharacterized protein (DUF1684 family)